MIVIRDPVSATFERLQASGAEVPWVGRELSAKQAVVRGKRILLVEDQEPLRAPLRMMLELDGHQVTEASNGAEALNLFTIGDFDLVITDFEMPVMKGNELAVSLKLLAPSLPILMITASDRARGDVENPVDALLSKPLTVPDLRCALGKLLSARPDLAQPSALAASVEFAGPL
jgi:two-component system capsular synthesis sensor histidine kinase RcsC